MLGDSSQGFHERKVNKNLPTIDEARPQKKASHPLSENAMHFFVIKK
jgi:hypothetical protein